MIRRNIEPRILQALNDTPVVLIHGARQTGKSTLAEWIASHPHPARYLTLDDAGTLSAANADAVGFISGLQGRVVIDEVQLAPGLFRAIKMEVDRERQPGRFLLTGSANALLIPQLSESLAGRMEIHRLWPFSQWELAGYRENFIDLLFESRSVFPEFCPMKNIELLKRMITRGFREAIHRESQERRRAWFGAYITTILQRDVRNLAEIEGLIQMPRLLSILATQSASLLNVANLARSVGIANATLKRYLALLEATFLIQMLPAWSGNVRKRLIRTSKVYFTDSGVLAYLLDADENQFEGSSPWAGPLLENFVCSELHKQLSWSQRSARLFYYRTTNGREVDFVMEDSKGCMVGIEVKASATIGRSDLRGLEDLKQTVGQRFLRGILLYMGSEIVPFGPSMHALPLSALWKMGATEQIG